MRYFALMDDGFFYALGDCGDFTSAEEVVAGMGMNSIWITDELVAMEWAKTVVNDIHTGMVEFYELNKKFD